MFGVDFFIIVLRFGNIYLYIHPLVSSVHGVRVPPSLHGHSPPLSSDQYHRTPAMRSLAWRAPTPYRPPVSGGQSTRVPERDASSFRTRTAESEGSTASGASRNNADVWVNPLNGSPGNRKVSKPLVVSGTYVSLSIHNYLSACFVGHFEIHL